jgi:hypothetical protein
MSNLSSLPNPYTYDVPTFVIIYLYNLIVEFLNPLAAIQDNNLTYVMLDLFKFNPICKDPRLRFLLSVIDVYSNIKFYTVNMGYRGTLTSLEPIINIYKIPILQLRIQYFFVKDAERIGLRYAVTNINKLAQQKIAIANLNNLPGTNYILWNNLFLSFIIYQDGTKNSQGMLNMRLCLSQSAYYDPKTQKWDSSVIQYDIDNGTLIAMIDEKPAFAINSQQFFYFNYEFYMPNDPNNFQLVGGKGNFIYNIVDAQIAMICDTQELQYQAPQNSAELLLFAPVDQYYEIACSLVQGNLYLYGFEGLNNINNFYTIAQLASFSQQYETMFFVGVKSIYTQEILPQNPIFSFDGLVIWPIIVEGNFNFVIYQPTFPDFLAKHSLGLQGVNDLIFK